MFVHMYLGANVVITAVQQGTDVPQVIADGIHRGIIFDVDINECCDERSRQLLAPDHYVLKTCSFHLLLKLLQTQKIVAEWAMRAAGTMERSHSTPGQNRKVSHSGRHMDEYRSDDVWASAVTGEVIVHTCTFGSSDIIRLNWWSQRSFHRVRVW